MVAREREPGSSCYAGVLFRRCNSGSRFRASHAAGALAAFSLLASCSGDDLASTGTTGDGRDAGLDSGHANGTGGGAGTGGGVGVAGTDAVGAGGAAPDPCLQAQMGPDVGTTYYVAMGVTEADNAACDGLSPTDEGGGHCPFRDFSSPRTASLLDGASGVKVVVRAGTYLISGWDGLRVTGAGTAETTRVVLTA